MLPRGLPELTHILEFLHRSGWAFSPWVGLPHSEGWTTAGEGGPSGNVEGFADFAKVKR